MRMKITTAGRAKLVNGTNTGTNAVLISHIGLTATAFTPSAAMTQLPGEFKRMTSFGGKSVAADTIHVTLQDSGADTYTLRGFGLYLSDGTLFAVYGQADAIMEKASISTLLLSADVVLADIDTAQIKFGSTEFLNPPGTETVAGVVELASSAETAAGTDAVRAITPRGFKAALDGRFGSGAPTPFVKTLLALATAAAIRTSLEVKGAALKDMGHGKGLDADTLDGLHASDFPQRAEVQFAERIPSNNAQVRWIKLASLDWVGYTTSVFMAEVSNGGNGARRYVLDLITASTRAYTAATTVLTQKDADAIIGHSRLGLKDSVQSPMRVGVTLRTNADGTTSGVDLWLQQYAYQHGHCVRPINVTAATYNGVNDFVTVEPAGIIYAAPEVVAYESDLRRLVDSTESRWGKLQTFALGAALPNNQRLRMGEGGGELRGSETGSVVLSSGEAEGGFVYLRPNGTYSTAGQVVIYKSGIMAMPAARIGSPGDGASLLELAAERAWHFKQRGQGSLANLELFDATGGKGFLITNASNDRAITLLPSAGAVSALEFRGRLVGNADTADKFSTPRTVNGISFDGSANIVTPTWGAQRSIKIGNVAKVVNGSADVAWSLTEIGAAAISHNHVIDDVVDLRPALDERIKAVSGDSWESASNRDYASYRSSTAANGLPNAYTVGVALPSPDAFTGIALASYYGALQRFWMRGRHDMGGSTGKERWKSWVELWHSANFNPATKANLSGDDFTGAISAPLFKATSNGFIGGAKYAVLAPDAQDGEVLLRPNGGASVVGQLSVTKTGLRWDNKGVWHAGNLDPATKANRIPGQIIMFAGKSAPAGTLLCNGAAVSRATYAALFAAIGTLYGSGDGSTTFNLPAMLEGTVVAHTQNAQSVGTPTNGEVIRHAHGASSASAGTHSHTITVAGGGAHSHSASAAAAGDHTHTTWTDAQGSHSHTVQDPGHAHTWVGPNRGGSGGWAADAVAAPAPTSTSHSVTGIWLDEAGQHAHNVGMDGSGNHTHSISVAQAGEHAHSASAANGGAHTHAITVDSTGGERNLPAGLRMIYCIAY